MAVVVMGTLAELEVVVVVLAGVDVMVRVERRVVVLVLMVVVSMYTTTEEEVSGEGGAKQKWVKLETHQKLRKFSFSVAQFLNFLQQLLENVPGRVLPVPHVSLLEEIVQMGSTRTGRCDSERTDVVSLVSLLLATLMCAHTNTHTQVAI